MEPVLIQSNYSNMKLASSVPIYTAASRNLVGFSMEPWSTNQTRPTAPSTMSSSRLIMSQLPPAGLSTTMASTVPCNPPLTVPLTIQASTPFPSEAVGTKKQVSVIGQTVSTARQPVLHRSSETAITSTVTTSNNEPLLSTHHPVNQEFRENTATVGMPAQNHYIPHQTFFSTTGNEMPALPHQAHLPYSSLYQQPIPTYWPPPYYLPQYPTPNIAAGILNAQQLAARHVVSRELPKFSGDPLEWPMFLSAFESTTTMCGIQPDENLARLQKCLVGKAREKVHSILTFPEAVPEIINTLRDECGRPDQLVHCLMNKIRNAPAPNVNRLETLVTFGREVRNLVTYIEAANLQDHLSNPMLLTELVGKLPPSIRLDWGLHTQRISQVTLKAFSDYVSSIKTAACQVTTLSETSIQDDPGRSGRKKERNAFINSHSVEVSNRDRIAPTKSQKQPQPCLMCQRSDHKIKTCNRFSSLSVAERWKLVEQQKICQRCLTCHGKCRTSLPCGIDKCEEMHHKLLHPGKPKPSAPVASGPRVVTTHRSKQHSTLFKILPVTLSNNGKSITTFAFLDDGSNVTLLENSIAETLGLEGEESSLCLQWTNNVTRKESTSKRVQLTVAGEGGNKRHLLTQVQTVDNLDLPRQTLDYFELVDQFPHLRGLPIKSYSKAVPTILIGADNARLKLPLNKRERRDDEPVAVKTKLGWTIFGGRRGIHVNNQTMVHICDCSIDQELHNLVKQYFEMDQLGLTVLSTLESEEDQRAKRILKETTRRLESGRFETGLLWKSDEIKFPDSYAMAVRRLKCLERRLQSEPDLRRNVDAQIEDYQKQGYAHKASAEELQKFDNQRVWYLPLGIVRNPRKPEKIRIVWDAAARVGGVSLNSMLLSGPDLLTPLMSVLCQFRQKQYAIAGDIKQMFHQLRIRQRDRQSQRFLWRTNPECTPEIFVMDVATFGATCSPCSAQYVKNLNAVEHEGKYPEAARAIIQNTYVDDYLDSRDTLKEAIQLAVEVREIHSNAGFEIRNWQSNHQEILRQIGVDPSSLQEAKSFTDEKSKVTERVLGMLWEPNEDLFVFSVQFHQDLLPILSGEVVPTKRQVLRVVMSLFDPLGLIASFTIHGKILIQNIWRSGVSWDQRIIDSDFTNWKRWIKLVPELQKVHIPRCYFPNYDRKSYESLQLHVFVDASEVAYCGVAYFRIIDRGMPRCSLVAAKAKVTPLRPQSIPRNELNAGIIGVRLMKTITENHSLQITKRYFHTDSTVLLAWLRADPRKYRPYVQFRTTEILTETELEDWRWVPTRLNIADEATKWGNGPSFDAQSKWYRGPDFLWQPESEWPEKRVPTNDPVEDLRRTNVHHGMCKEVVLDFVKYSRWKDIIKSLAYLYHFVNRCSTKQRVRSSSRTVMLTRQDYVSAETGLWRMIQAQEFEEEIIAFHNSKSSIKKEVRLAKSSSLSKLSAFMDEDGVLRMESRIDPKAAYYPYSFRNPIIVPREHYVTELLVLKFHQQYGHANNETVVNELRQLYYIPVALRGKRVDGRCVERKVRSIKDALKVLAHREKLDDEGLSTLLAEASMIVNSRPLTFVPLESPGHEVLTPNNFLLMSSNGVNNHVRFPINESISLRTNWGVMQHILDQFWASWIKSYLPTIARRTKWFNDVRPLQVGDLVVIVDETVRNGWLRGRIIKTFPGIDGQVRKVDVQTESGVLQRPAIKVALLDVLDNGNAN
ncbi:uncharacterized protein LOC134222069 [Armigeres subalbatus]|uniref:uncharacterized protein LOC134222069 n=1 Tax=Armigeres subalbatus TaxID=124917 RepID=UPI002ED2DC4B